MNTKTTFNTILATTFTAFGLLATAPAIAYSVGDANPGYPIHIDGQYEAAPDQKTLMTTANQPAQRSTQSTGAVINGEAFIFPEPVGVAKTRAQVKAETLAAIRVGAIGHGERFVFPTEQQLDTIHMAGLNALAPTMAAGRDPVIKN